MVDFKEKLKLTFYCSMYKTKLITYILSAVYLCMGAIVLALGVQVYTNTDEALEDFDLNSAAVSAIVAGAFLAIVGFTGIVAAKLKNQHLIMVFIIASLFTNLILFSSGIALLVYRKYIENVIENDIASSLEEKILTYELAVYSDCCDPNSLQPELCELNGNIFPCIADSDTFNGYKNFIGADTCSYFSSIVSETDQEACGGQVPIGFVPVISGFLIGNLTLIGALDLTAAIILTLITGVVLLIWYTVEEDVVEEKDYIYENPMPFSQVD